MSTPARNNSAAAPTVTIGLPVYNGQSYIDETIDSVVNQTYHDFELVICDNASTDKTGEICAKRAAADSRIRYIRNERNIGSVGNHRRTLELARGKYFRFASANDLCRPQLLERCVAILDKHPEVVVTYGLTTLIDDDGKVTSEYDKHMQLDSPRASDRFISYLRTVGYINQFAGLVRTEELRRARPMGDYISSDIVLLAELALMGQFHEIQEPLFLRRMSLNASTQGKTLSQLKIFYNPFKPNRIVLPLWRQQWELLGAVFRSNISGAEKRRAVWFVTKCYYWRWRQLAAEIGGVFGQLAGRS